MEAGTVRRMTLAASIVLAVMMGGSGLSAPLLYPFGRNYPFQMFARTSAVAEVYDDVADAPARLSLLGISVGHRVHQVDNNTVYQYNGPSTDAVAGMIVSGTTVDGTFTVRGTSDSKNYYNLVGIFDDPTANAIAWVDDGHGGGIWQIFDAFGAEADNGTTNVATPDLDTGWSFATVTIDHIASESNWSIVP